MLVLKLLICSSSFPLSPPSVSSFSESTVAEFSPENCFPFRLFLLSLEKSSIFGFCSTIHLYRNVSRHNHFLHTSCQKLLVLRHIFAPSVLSNQTSQLNIDGHLVKSELSPGAVHSKPSPSLVRSLLPAVMILLGDLCTYLCNRRIPASPFSFQSVIYVFVIYKTTVLSQTSMKFQFFNAFKNVVTV